MAEIGPPGPATAVPSQSCPAHAQIDALRARGAEGFDPVGLRFLDALARRTAQHHGNARRTLDARLAKAVADYGERFDRAKRETAQDVAHAEARFPELSEELRRHRDDTASTTLRRLLARAQARGTASPLSVLLAHIGGLTADGRQAAPLLPGAGASPTARPELRSLSHFRSTWTKLSIDRQLAQAFAQAPENAGPLNAHSLVLQSLRQMRDIAPGYLERFLSYTDALLWLDQAESGRAPAPKGAPRAESSKKRK